MSWPRAGKGPELAGGLELANGWSWPMAGQELARSGQTLAKNCPGAWPGAGQPKRDDVFSSGICDSENPLTKTPSRFQKADFNIFLQDFNRKCVL